MKMQAAFRGNIARRYLTEVISSIKQLRYERSEQAQEAVTLRLQLLTRSRYARQKFKGKIILYLIYHIS